MTQERHATPRTSPSNCCGRAVRGAIAPGWALCAVCTQRTLSKTPVYAYLVDGHSPRLAMLRDAIGVRNGLLAVEEAGACLLVGASWYRCAAEHSVGAVA